MANYEYELTIRTDSADHIIETMRGGLRFEKKVEKAAELGDAAAAVANAKPKKKPPKEKPPKEEPPKEEPPKKEDPPKQEKKPPKKEDKPAPPPIGKPEENGASQDDRIPTYPELKDFIHAACKAVSTEAVVGPIMERFKVDRLSALTSDQYVEAKSIALRVLERHYA